MRALLLICMAFIFCGEANAENFICGKMKGTLLSIQDKYVPVEFEAKNLILNISDKSATIIAGQEKQDCLILQNTERLMLCMSVESYSANMWTYYKDKKRLVYSKHNMLLQTQSQYYSDCDILR